MNSSSMLSNHLKYTFLPIITNTQCIAIYGGLILENMLCAGGIAGRGACRGRNTHFHQKKLVLFCLPSIFI